VVECRHGIKLFAGQRRDPFYNFIPFPVATTTALANGTFPDFDALRPASGSAHVDYNATVPTDDLVGRPAHPATDPASGIWGQVRDNVAAVVEAGGTYRNRPHRFPTALAYGAWAADTLLPNVITFTPGTVALWDPWFDVKNGTGVIEDIASNIIKMVVNQDFSSGLKPEPLQDHFPYLSPPPPAS